VKVAQNLSPCVLFGWLSIRGLRNCIGLDDWPTFYSDREFVFLNLSTRDFWKGLQTRSVRASGVKLVVRGFPIFMGDQVTKKRTTSGQLV
jgi:hypothetical protein